MDRDTWSMKADQKLLVANAYDRIADAYLSVYGVSSVRQRWLERLIDRLPSKTGNILDLGCGAGVPVARTLANLGCSVTGVDGSVEQIARARAFVPEAEFIHADMTLVELDACQFDAVGAFYSITHVPAGEHGDLFRRIARWLKPGGIFLASLGTGDGGDWKGEWLGQPMFFSHNSEQASMALLREAGLLVVHSEFERQDNEDASFLWIVAVRPVQ